MHPEVVEALRCPLDGGGLIRADRSLRCADGHSFDLARQGYVNLALGGDAGTGDDAAMVAARAEVLASGRLATLTDALADHVAVRIGASGVVVDLGAGTGHHLAGVLERLPERVGVAVDLSKHAARRAARSHPRAGAVVADVWRAIPVRDGVAAAVLCVFAPRNPTEIRRILRPDGLLVVATPMRSHLGELVGPLGLLEVDARKAERLATALGPGFVEDGEVQRVEERWQLDRAEIRALVAMGPSADHLPGETLRERVARLPEPVAVTAAVELRTYRPR